MTNTPTQSTDKIDRLSTDKIGRLILIYSIPAIVGTISMAIYNIADRIFIGQGVGALAISGLALTFPFMNILGAFGMLVGAGSALRISITLGEGQREKAEQILTNTFTLLFIFSGLAILLSYIFIDELLILFGGREETIGYAKEYMKIIIPGSMLSSLSYAFSNNMRSSGAPRKAMITMLICAGLNIILDALFINIFNMGIKGAAHATNISFLVGSIWVLTHFLLPSTPIRFRKKFLILKADIVKSILSLGLTPFCMFLATSLVLTLFNTQLIRHGGNLAVGAFGLINGYTMLFFMIIIGLSQGVQPIIGYNYGARNYDRVYKTLKTSIVIATIICLIGSLLGMIVPKYIARAFTNNPELLEITEQALRIATWALSIVGFQIVVSNFFQAIGKVKIAIFLSLTRQFIFLIPLIMTLPYFWGLKGVWAALPVSDILSTTATALTLYFFIRRFKNSGVEAK